MIPRPIESNVFDRARRVKNDICLSDPRHIEHHISTNLRAKGLITSFFPTSLIPSKSQTEPLLPLHIMMSPRAMTPENQELILPSASVVEIPDSSAPAPTEDLSAEAEASGISGGSFIPPTTTMVLDTVLVKRRPYSVHSGMGRTSNTDERDTEWNNGYSENGAYRPRTH
ncbi:hypothetical protein ARMSODRAFT_1024701 [Armillaria solidipes]|uniref:Uncharacterized protein n=1 Tax=Armillaria solidipes TaxID=1076256 RepID=A0A2H3B1D8_9AGAR|nr:hypothetical protein ARMSODRAFT_1024701 [Armillaria solidipes]